MHSKSRPFSVFLKLSVFIGMLLVSLCSFPALAQNSLDAGFERDVNRYRWTSEAMVGLDLGRWTLQTKNLFRSDAFLLFGDQLSFRDENRFSFRGQRPTGNGQRQIVSYGRADWYSLSRVFRQDTWFGMRWEGAQPFWIEPVIGLAIDSRPGFGVNRANAPMRTDLGPGFGLDFGLPMTEFNGYFLTADGEARFERTSPRVGRLLRSHVFSRRTFENTTVQTRFKGASVRRDAYQSASFLNRDDAVNRQSETVESTRSDTLDLELMVDSRISSTLSFSGGMNVSTNSRSVRTLRAPSEALFFDSNFNRRIVEGNLAAMYVKGNTRARFAMRVGAEVERRRLDNADDLPSAQAAQKLNLLRQADNERGYLSLQHTLNTSLNRWWQIQFDGSANILKHDTPEINQDDRDELLYNVMFGSRFHVGENLDLTVQVLGSWFHTVYLKAVRSAENNIQRSLRYRPSVEWTPSRKTRFRYTNEVRATYTVDDFLLPGRRPTDQAAREMRHEIQTEHSRSSGMVFKVDASYSDLRLGRFLDKVFAEIPVDTLRTYSGWVRVQTGNKVQAEIGIRFYIRSDFDRSANVRYTIPETQSQSSISRMGRTRIDQIGPTTSISWTMRRNAFIRLEGWAVRQRVSRVLYGEFPDGLGSVIKKAASRGQTSIIPNVSVSMKWTW